MCIQVLILTLIQASAPRQLRPVTQLPPATPDPRSTQGEPITTTTNNNNNNNDNNNNTHNDDNDSNSNSNMVSFQNFMFVFAA